MILNIPESNGKLLDNIKIYLVIYFKPSCKNLEELAKKIGISKRALQEWFNRYPELEFYRYEKTMIGRTTSGNPYWDDGPSWRRSR